MKRTFLVSWSSSGEIRVEAESKAEAEFAIQRALDNGGLHSRHFVHSKALDDYPIFEDQPQDDER